MFGRKNRATSGAIVIDGHHAQDTRQCTHCGRHEIVTQGSGVKRGWCLKCMGFVCGRETCMKYCIPYEARIEYEEAISKNATPKLRQLAMTYPDIVHLVHKNFLR